MPDSNNGSHIASASNLGAIATVRRGIQLTPELINGIWLTLALAVLAAAGKVVIPITVQQAVDATTSGAENLLGEITTVGTIALIAIAVAALSTTAVNIRLVRNAERGLARLRQQAFRHIHRLSVLTQNTERRGALVSRVTSDVDTISLFVQWGGIMLLTSVLQLVAATAVMLFYSWQLTILVWVTFIPFMFLLRPAQRRVNVSFTRVRSRMGDLLGAVSEAIVGSSTVYSYGIADKTREKITTRVNEHRSAGVQAMTHVAYSFAAGVFAANLVLVVVVIAGAYLGVAGNITAGQLVAFLFLTQLFTGPVQLATEVLNELQNAVAGWRRVIAVIETPIDVTSPENSVTQPPRGPGALTITDVAYRYPGGDLVLNDVNLHVQAGKRVAVVGETGSGKTTLAKLVTRFADPTHGHIAFDGIDLKDHSQEDLRTRILLIPQEGFLFNATIAENIAYGISQRHPGITQENITQTVHQAIHELGLTPWLSTLPNGENTEVGQRGERLSAGERQLIALARAYISGADLIVMDEVTSAVDPATEVTISRALEKLMDGKSTLTIAHRLSTAAASDHVVVMDSGRVVEQGTHEQLLALQGRYSAMYNAWISQTTSQQH
ncbi:ABC transporter ATP-binding protein [Jonesia quinghaiensis]|uniref:ABC transporter ATP-binding protein n=1 Tax=Jonesia quinghaiensis TaxID=262806 RepID=UPI0003F9FAF4|nr:ABC transporter ATP-binding protein [Jonesia quinghaiensis]